MAEELEVVELADPRDPRVCAWLDIFQQQFPIEEQVPCSMLLAVLQQKAQGEAEEQHLLLATEAGETRAMAWLEEYPDQGVAALWYLAVPPGAEGAGAGSRMMRHLVDLAFARPTCRLLVLEVERPDAHTHPETDAQREARLDQIRKRNRFYHQRFGFLFLSGIDYRQQAGWSDPVPMDLMVLPRSGEELTAAEALERLALVFGESLRVSGTPALAAEAPR